MGDIINDQIPFYLFLFLALVCFFVIIFRIFKNRRDGGSILIALFFLCVIFAYFPRLESMSAFSMTVKLRDTINDANNTIASAKEIMEKLRRVALSSAKATYV